MIHQIRNGFASWRVDLAQREQLPQTKIRRHKETTRFPKGTWPTFIRLLCHRLHCTWRLEPQSLIHFPSLSLSWGCREAGRHWPCRDDVRKSYEVGASNSRVRSPSWNLPPRLRPPAGGTPNPTRTLWWICQPAIHCPQATVAVEASFQSRTRRIPPAPVGYISWLGRPPNRRITPPKAADQPIRGLVSDLCTGEGEGEGMARASWWRGHPPGWATPNDPFAD